MGHWCWVCKRSLPNERFSVKGRARHICRDCKKRPASEREELRLFQFLDRMLDQSHISEKNIDTLNKLTTASNPKLAAQAQVLLEVAHFQPYKRRRLKNMSRQRKDLMEKLSSVGLLDWTPRLEWQEVADESDELGEFMFEENYLDIDF